MSHTAHNGATERIVAYVKAHPGCLRTEVLASIGASSRNTMSAYAERMGLIHVAGPKRRYRYYPTAEMAAEADPRLRAEHAEAERQRARTAWSRRNLKLRAQRQAEGRRAVNTRPGMGAQLDSETVIPETVKLTVAAPFRGRWETPEPPPSVFGSLAIGSYMPSDSAIARAYGGGRCA